MFEVEVFTGDPEAETYAHREKYDRGCLTLRGVSFFVVEPPDPTYDARSPFLIDLCSPRNDREGSPGDGSFTGDLFISSTNSFIRFRAREAEFDFEKK